MCGIFGYIGSKTNASETVLDGLKLLEYRGYDSWGIAVKIQNPKIQFEVEKHVGKIGDAKVNLPESNLGIGHTRWATHGGVTVENAHPHLDCHKEIAVIHNGIVENYQEIKDELLQKGHTFLSATDTEVIPHLIEEYLKTEGFASAVRDTFNRLSGLNAIVVAYTPSAEIIAAKTGSPLVVGRGKDELFIASDVSGIIKHTKEVLFLKDSEMVILGKDVQLLSLPKGEKLTPSFETITWNIEDVTKGEYKHFMIKEIHEQPKIVRNIAQTYADQIRTLAAIIKKSRGTFLIGAGTASNACVVGAYLFSKIAKTHINTAFASEFNYLEDFLTNESLIIALSQSGETIDVIEPLNRARKKGSKIVGLINSLGSTIYRMADHKVLFGAGPEKAVASTKVYIAMLSLLIYLAFAMDNREKEAEKILLDAAAEMERILTQDQDSLKTIVNFLKTKEHLYIIGRGMSYPTSLEAALKIKEVSYIHTEGLAGGELKHGPIALIEKGTPCIVFAPKDETYEAMISNAMEIKARGGIIIGVSSEKADVFDYWINVATVNEATILPQIVPIQLLAYYLAVEKGFDPDKPRNLAKSVTVK
jgi:glucosamine--fructose-6-phosphate aminotransferase (isomerizing)